MGEALMTRLDVRGTRRPVPVIMIRRALLRLESGVILEVTADDRTLISDLPAFCAHSGHRLIMAEEREDRVVFAIAAREAVSGRGAAAPLLGAG